MDDCYFLSFTSNLMVSGTLSVYPMVCCTIQCHTISGVLYHTSTKLVAILYHAGTWYTLSSCTILHIDTIRGWYQYGVCYRDDEPWFIPFVFNLDFFNEVAELTDPNLHFLFLQFGKLGLDF